MLCAKIKKKNCDETRNEAKRRKRSAFSSSLSKSSFILRSRFEEVDEYYDRINLHTWSIRKSVGSKRNSYSNFAIDLCHHRHLFIDGIKSLPHSKSFDRFIFRIFFSIFIKMKRKKSRERKVVVECEECNIHSNSLHFEIQKSSNGIITCSSNWCNVKWQKKKNRRKFEQSKNRKFICIVSVVCRVVCRINWIVHRVSFRIYEHLAMTKSDFFLSRFHAVFLFFSPSVRRNFSFCCCFLFFFCFDSRLAQRFWFRWKWLSFSRLCCRRWKALHFPVVYSSLAAQSAIVLAIVFFFARSVVEHIFFLFGFSFETEWSLQTLLSCSKIDIVLCATSTQVAEKKGPKSCRELCESKNEPRKNKSGRTEEKHIYSLMKVSHLLLLHSHLRLKQHELWTQPRACKDTKIASIFIWLWSLHTCKQFALRKR